MENRIEDIQYCEKLFDRFYDVGSTEDGGVTRLGYSEQEDEMHAVFSDLAKELDCTIFHDEVGNTYASNSGSGDYYLVGSHLDSVIEGGRYDGVAGIIAGLMVMRWAKKEGVGIPLRVGAFRCEESSNFGCCTIGSGLITKEIYKQDVGSLMSKAGESLEQIFKERGLSLHPSKISGIRQYLELHIEQGKVLEEAETPVGIVQTIAGPRRFKLYLRGMAEHSGATPMGMRCDAMCAASEIILELERIGNREAVYQSVATVGVVNNHPNALNVIPGEVELGVDIRGIENSSLDRMEREMRESAKRICKKRGIEYMEIKTSEIPPIDMSEDVQNGLERAAKRIGVTCRRMVSGAGHDAMSFAGICHTGMVFIPCTKGVSHNRMEFASISDICEGARVIYEYLKEEAS
ncbi:hydantoinase/carbamoylase family amidase [Lachnospiraceae bacterium SGI.054]